MKITEKIEFDAFDRKIVNAISSDGRITITQLSEIVGLSKSPCHARLKRLEEVGVILGIVPYWIR